MLAGARELISNLEKVESTYAIAPSRFRSMRRLLEEESLPEPLTPHFLTPLFLTILSASFTALSHSTVCHSASHPSI